MVQSKQVLQKKLCYKVCGGGGKKCEKLFLLLEKPQTNVVRSKL